MRSSTSFSKCILSLSVTAILAAYGAPSYAADAPQTNAVATATTAGQTLNSLAEEYYERLARFEPLAATFNGDNRFDDQLPKTLAPAERAKEAAFFAEIAQRLSSIARDQLNANDAVTYDLLQYETNEAIAISKFDDHLLPLNQMDSVPVSLATFGSGQSSQPLETVEQYDIYLRRLQQLPIWIDQAIANMRVGIQRKIVLPRALVVSALPQFKELATTPLAKHPCYLPITHFPASFSAQDKTRLTAAYQAALKKSILPSYVKLHRFLAKEYLPASRSTSGWGALPNGAVWYQAWVKDQTTTDLTPEQIHAIGEKEVARIQAEFAQLGPKLGYSGAPNGLPTWIATQDKYRPFKSEAEILDTYRQIDAKIRAKLPSLFSVLPKAALDIRPEPEISRDTASDHYTPPAIDGSRPGIFWAVITDPSKYSTTGMTTLFLHEGQPGHHFHLSFLQELNIPKFRKFGGNNAYTEGWALYAETLGKEMGLYEDPNAYLGHLTDELLRAARLVVDTGIHAQGWSREQAIAYFRTTLGYDEATARSAIERYMAWPGQALGYKLGSLKIMELRQRAQTALGDKFDLRKFHDAILSDGTLPLSLLDRKMNLWIEQQKKL